MVEEWSRLESGIVGGEGERDGEGGEERRAERGEREERGERRARGESLWRPGAGGGPKRWSLPHLGPANWDAGSLSRPISFRHPVDPRVQGFFDHRTKTEKEEEMRCPRLSLDPASIPPSRVGTFAARMGCAYPKHGARVAIWKMLDLFFPWHLTLASAFGLLND